MHKRAAGDLAPRPAAEGGARGLGDLFSGLEAAAAERDVATTSERAEQRGVDSDGEAEELDAAAEPPGGWVERARTPLFRAKRAEQLCWLLRAKRTLDQLLPAPGRGEALSALMAIVPMMGTGMVRGRRDPRSSSSMARDTSRSRRMIPAFSRAFRL